MNNMSFSYLEFLAAIIILSCILTYGMGKKSADTSVQPPAETKSSEEIVSAERNSSPMKDEKSAHQQHPRVKPGAAVSLKDITPLYAPVPGVYEFQLQLISPNDTGKMTIDVAASDGVTIVSPETHFEFVLQEGGEYKLPLALNASAEGRFYVQLHVSIVADGKTSMRAIAAILQVGAPTVKVQKTISKSSADKSHPVISLPAQETISPR